MIFTEIPLAGAIITVQPANGGPEITRVRADLLGRFKIALAPGTYEYCLVVDGHWMADPLAKDFVPNPFGGRNSVLKVAVSTEAAHLADAENLPLKNTNK